MNTQIINIKKPSEKALVFLRNLRAEKQSKKAMLVAKKDIYFPEKL